MNDELPVAEPSPLHTTTIVEKCTLKLVDDYKHMLCQATEPLSTFLEYITYVNFTFLFSILVYLLNIPHVYETPALHIESVSGV
jgi:hypothetical protein